MPPVTALVTRPAVEIAAVGSWGAISEDGSAWVVTEQSITDAVNASRDPAFRTPVIKLGHSDPFFTAGEDPQFGRDGIPSVGRLTNLRASPDGQSLLADLTGMPKWLDEVMASAYPSRSTESLNGVVPGRNGVYSMVVTGLALLGETVPAIESLADVADLFGVDTDISTWAAARRVAAAAVTTPLKEQAVPEPTKVTASARIEDLYQAAEAWAKGQDSVPSEAWPREIYTDYLILCDYDGRLWKTTWTESSGEFSFGEASRVQITYTPLADTVSAAAAHAMHSPVSYRRQQTGTVSAGSGSPSGRSLGETSVSIAPALRAAVGMEDSADEAAVEAAILAKLNAPVVEPAPTITPEATVTPSAPVNTAPATTVIPAAQSEHDPSTSETRIVDVRPDLAQQVAAAVSAALPAAVSAHIAPLAASNEALRADLGRVTAELATAKQTEAEKVRSAVINSAIAAGKIRTADRERFLKLYDKAPAETLEHLDSIAPGTAVPISAAGYAGEEAQDADEFKTFEEQFGWGVSNG